MVIGSAGVVAPELVTSVLGAAVFVHGTDTAWTGLRTLWNGEVQETVTEQAAQEVARFAGADEDTAQTVGAVTDMTVGIGGSIATATRRGVQESVDQTMRRMAPSRGEPVSKTDEAWRNKIEESLGETFSGGAPGCAYKTTCNLARGNFGERSATEALASEGHKIISYKPSITGTNQPGIDMITVKNGIVHFVDNKALTRSGNVSSVTALVKNFIKNKATALQELEEALKIAGSKEQLDVLQSAITAIKEGNYKRVVTNANLASDDKILSGITKRLKDEGLEFIDVFKVSD